MKLLMVDTATIVASAAVIDDDRLMAETIVNYRRKHSEKMLPAIDHMLQDSGLSIQEIDVFGVVRRWRLICIVRMDWFVPFWIHSGSKCTRQLIGRR